jgi:hypothetical protein
MKAKIIGQERTKSRVSLTVQYTDNGDVVDERVHHFEPVQIEDGSYKKHIRRHKERIGRDDEISDVVGEEI